MTVRSVSLKLSTFLFRQHPKLIFLLFLLCALADRVLIPVSTAHSAVQLMDHDSSFFVKIADNHLAAPRDSLLKASFRLFFLFLCSFGYMSFYQPQIQNRLLSLDTMLG